MLRGARRTCMKQHTWHKAVHRLLDHPRTTTTMVADPFGEPPERVVRRVVITGLGLVTPLGIGFSNVWSRLLNGECGIREITAEDLPEGQRSAFDGLPAKIAGTVCLKELAKMGEALEVTIDSHRMPRFVQFAMVAAAEALADSGWRPSKQEGRERTGVAIGSGMSASADLAQAGQLVGAGQPRRLNPFLVPRILANMAAGAVSMEHQFLGPNHSVSTACTTGAHSIGDAFNFVRNGDADVMVAGGTEACIDAVSIGGFSRMRALETRYNTNPAAASRPFDAGRGGFVIGEGAGILVLEELQHAMARGAPIYAEVRGYGLSADAHHITQPAPDGRGAVLAMKRAIAGSGLEVASIAYINAHATGTPLGDAVEAAAIARMLAGPSKPAGDLRKSLEGQDVELRLQYTAAAVSSTKGATGHLLGAAGAVEAVFSILALVSHQAPPTLNLMLQDPIVLGLRLVGSTPRRLHAGPKAVMSNSFGFGGTNASLLFATPPSLTHEVADGLP